MKCTVFPEGQDTYVPVTASVTPHSSWSLTVVSSDIQGPHMRKCEH